MLEEIKNRSKVAQEDRKDEIRIALIGLILLN